MTGNVIFLPNRFQFNTLYPNTYAHPDYTDMLPIWQKIRDVVAGSEVVKAKGKEYLPGFCRDDGDGYREYLQRAIFVPYARKLVSGIVGYLFSAPVVVKHKTRQDPDTISPQHRTFETFARQIAQDVVSIGRVGVLVDYNNNMDRAYAHIFLAENIINWEYDHDGNLTYLLLREVSRYTPKVYERHLVTQPNVSAQSQTITTYLEYRLDENGNVVVTRYDDAFSNPQNIPLRVKNKVPTRIPFVFFGATDNTPDINEPPILDVVNLNIAHYQNAALLQLGRKSTAFPIYYVPIEAGQAEPDKFVLNPSYVWVVSENSKPGVLEFYGQGLNHLANSLAQIESQIVQIAGRITGLRSTDTKYEAPDIFRLLYDAETSVLTSYTNTLTSGLKEVVELWLEYNSTPGTPEDWQVRIDMREEFNASTVDARGLRAISALYKEGMLSLENAFKVLQNSGFIPRKMSFEEYKAKIEEEIAKREQIVNEMRTNNENILENTTKDGKREMNRNNDNEGEDLFNNS